MLFDAGLAGICVPREYGGQGLSPAHQQALNEELAGYEFPGRQQAPTFSPCLPVLLEFGTEEQKLRHIPPILKGEQLWMQFLSEPSGGSDVAGALTTAVRDRASPSILAVPRAAGRLDDPVVRDLIGEARMLQLVSDELERRLTEGFTTGAMPDQASAIGRLFHGVTTARIMTITHEIAGAASPAGADDDGALVHASTDFP